MKWQIECLVTWPPQPECAWLSLQGTGIPVVISVHLARIVVVEVGSSPELKVGLTGGQAANLAMATNNVTSCRGTESAVVSRIDRVYVNDL